MRPHDLVPPFSRAEQRIAISDRVWYIPTRSDTPLDGFTFPGWNHPDLFGNDNPVVVEYCSGNGDWIAGKALENPSLNWVAVEKKFDRVRKIWAKIKNLQLKNLIVICGEAYRTTSLFFADESIFDVYINFPDPWPKYRHTKNRIISGPFSKELWRILKKESALTFVTDDPSFSTWGISVIQGHGGFVSLYPEPFFTTDEGGYGYSYFERLWRAKGKIIRYHRFIKKV